MRVRYENGLLRQFRIGRDEVLRMIYFAVRDRHWQTVLTTLTNEVIDRTDSSFRIRYDWTTSDPAIQMSGQVTIVGESDGIISVDFYGKAGNSFMRNRIGLCVLHPIDGVAGQLCQIENPDGNVTTGHFPTFISPHQPFLSIRAMRWQPASGHELQLSFSGDVFETEDQRNWTDASFKTYSTPLIIPFPAAVSPGDEVRQRVVFRVMKQAEGLLTTDTASAKVDEQAANPSGGRPPEPVAVWPRVGVGQRTDGRPLTESEAGLLRNLNLAHLRADVLLTTDSWQFRLTQAASDARLLHVPLELALFFGVETLDELTELLAFVDRHEVPIGTVLVFDVATLITSDILLQRVVPVLRSAWPAVLIGGGTDGFFVDINRHPVDWSLVDFVTYSISPQAHAFDDLTVLENIDGQRATVETARHLTSSKPVHISPVTLLPRYMTTEQSATGRLSPPVDSRQVTPFGADWTRQSLLTLARSGVASVTYYESHGPLGLVDGDVVFPVYDALLPPGAGLAVPND